MTRLERLASCGLYRVPTAASIAVVKSSDGTCSMAGVMVCGLVWACPVCSAKIRNKRAVELEDLVLRHVNAGGGAGFGTLTLPHGRGDRLKPLLVAVAKSWTAVRQSRGVRSAMEQLGIVGFVRAVEITYGDNGWHPHLHVLALTTRQLGVGDWSALEAAIASAWAKAVVRQGFRAPSAEHGVRWQPVVGKGGGQALARYLAKVQDDGFDRPGIANEMVRGDLKSGRRTSVGMFELLDGAMRRDPVKLRLWHEYEQATRGHRVLTWSQGLRDQLGALPELADEEVANEPDGVEVVAELTDLEHRRVVQYGAEARLLDIAEREGSLGVATLLRILGNRARFEAGRCPTRLRATAGAAT